MGESGRGFGLAVMRKSKLNENSKKKKTKIINMIISHFDELTVFEHFNAKFDQH